MVPFTISKASVAIVWPGEAPGTRVNGGRGTFTNRYFSDMETCSWPTIAEYEHTLLPIRQTVRRGSSPQANMDHGLQEMCSQMETNLDMS